MSPGLDTLHTANATVQLTATAKASDGRPITGKSFTWSSSQPAVAQVNASGLIQAATNGTTIISASTDQITGTATVVVDIPAPPTRIQGTITLSNAFLSPGTVSLNGRAPVPGPSLPATSLAKAAALPHFGSGPRPAPAEVPAPLPEELIVTYRSSLVGWQPMTHTRLLTRPATAMIGTALSTAVRQSAAAGLVELKGVSPALMAVRIRLRQPELRDSVMRTLRRDPSVQDVSLNGWYTHHGIAGGASTPAPAALLGPDVLPTDVFYRLQAWHYRAISLPQAWRQTTGSGTVLVAVVDNGIRFDHPGIAAALTTDGFDFVSDIPVPLCTGGFISNAADGGGYDSDPTNPLDALLGGGPCVGPPTASGNHGLHVAGTIGAPANDGAGVNGVVGVNWSVRIRPVRVLGLLGGTNYDIAQGLLYAAGLPADNGQGGFVVAPSRAHIINMSLGGPSPSTIMQNAVTAAWNAGSLLVVSAGNSANSLPNYPAAYPEALSVTALGPDANLASYSSFGSTVDISAPGGDLADGDASFGILSTTWNYVSNTPSIDNSIWNGTSMAAPHVSGVAALLLAKTPGLSNGQLRQLLEQYAVDLGPPGRDDAYGSGVVNARNALNQSLTTQRTIYARLIDATTGAIVTTVPAPNGAYQFVNVAPGSYFVYAGEDLEGDGVIGVPNRRWGAYGGTAVPTTVQVTAGTITTVNFTIGLPSELEFNNTTGAADALPVGGYVIGGFSDPATDVDVTRIRIASSGTYTFETVGPTASCGFALDEDTVIQLLDSQGGLIQENDDIDFSGLNLCSRISLSLTPGTYYIVVRAFPSSQPLFGRLYAITARSGP